MFQTSLPVDPPVSGADRLPPIPPEAYDPLQRVAADALIASPRGAVRGPFVPLIRSPDLMELTQRLGAFLRYDCSVPVRLREFAILVAARIWSQPYEWHAHAGNALTAGVARETLAALAQGQIAAGAKEDEKLIFAYCAALHLNHRVDDACYAAVHALLGESGLVELTSLCGYYAMLAMVLNVARTPFPGEAFALPD